MTTGSASATGKWCDYYLSEMAVSDLHGGGLTLQTLLGHELNGVKRFIHVGRFACDLPPVSRILDRCETHMSWAESGRTRRLIGCRLSDWLHQRTLSRFVASVEAQLTKIVSDDRNAGWLLCPQSLLVPWIWNGTRSISSNYVTWVMDDHVIRLVDGKLSYPPGFSEVMERHLRHAKQVFVISPHMQQLYWDLFRVESTVLFGGCDPIGEPMWDSPSGPLHDIPLSATLAYFGSLGPWQVDALARLVNAPLPKGTTLDIFAPQREMPERLQHGCVAYRGGLPRDQVIGEMRRYDAVVLPISFLQSTRHMTDLNIATKMSECLASGTVTIVIGPEYSAMIQFLRPYNGAVLVTEPSAVAVADAIARCVDPIERRRLLSNARALVYERLTVACMKQAWNDGIARLGRVMDARSSRK